MSRLTHASTASRKSAKAQSSSGESSRWALSAGELRQLTEEVVAYATRLGATAAEADVSEGLGQSVTVRCGEVDTIEYNRDKGLGVTVYLGNAKGHASTSDLAPRAWQDTVAAALAIARHTAPDPCAGLPDADRLARHVPDLDLFCPWSLSIDQAIDLATRCEDAAFAVSDEVSNSEGATVSMQEGHFWMANSLGFSAGYPSSRHYIACSVIAGEGERMQRDDWYSTSRSPNALADPAAIGAYAARRALARQGARRVPTGRYPVLFEAPIAASLIGHLVHAASGGALYRKTSFLLDALGQPVLPDALSLSERPHLPGALASSAFDNEGVSTGNREVVEQGRLAGYFLSSYTGRKLGMPTTGNAGGSHNLLLHSSAGTRSFDQLLRDMGRGVLVTELLGQGVNYVTGDYSRGAAGYWVEGGEIQYPVEEFTIAGNLRDMLRHILAIGDDVVVRGSKQTGSILLSPMSVAGA